MKSLTVLLLPFALAACSTLNSSLNSYGQAYCQRPPDDRAIMSRQLDAVTEGFRVHIECPADVPSGQ